MLCLCSDVCLCNTVVSRQLGHSAGEFQCRNHEKAKKVSVVGEKNFLVKKTCITHCLNRWIFNKIIPSTNGVTRNDHRKAPSNVPIS